MGRGACRLAAGRRPPCHWVGSLWSLGQGPPPPNYICNCLRKSKEYFVTCENDVKFKFRNHGHSVTCCPGASCSFKRKSADLVLGCSLLPPVRNSPGKEP